MTFQKNMEGTKIYFLLIYSLKFKEILCRHFFTANVKFMMFFFVKNRDCLLLLDKEAAPKFPQ